jgi:hypothetical protein
MNSTEQSSLAKPAVSSSTGSPGGTSHGVGYSSGGAADAAFGYAILPMINHANRSVPPRRGSVFAMQGGIADITFQSKKRTPITAAAVIVTKYGRAIHTMRK